MTSPLNWNKGRIPNTKWTRSKGAKEKKSLLLNGMFVCQNSKRYNQIYRIEITISDTKKLIIKMGQRCMTKTRVPQIRG